MKYLYIYLILIIYIIKKAEGVCNQPTVSFALASSQYICNQYEKLYISYPSSFTSLSIDGSSPSVDIVNTRVVFNDLKAGPVVLNYTYPDSVDKNIICNGSQTFTSVPRGVNVQQPKCPWNQVQVVPFGDSSPTFSVNNPNQDIAKDQLFTTKPGTNYVRSAQYGCYYYFEVMPQSPSVPSIRVTPNSCDKVINGKVTVSNYASYTSLQLVGTNLTAVNGVFSGVASGSYILNATSASCGIQLIPVVVTDNIPTVKIDYSPMPCNGKYQINATFTVAGYPDATFNIDDETDIDGNSDVFAQDSGYTVYWFDSASGCQGFEDFVTPYSSTPLTFTVSPPLSTLSQPSIVTINYVGNYSDLQINGGAYVLNGTQFITNSDDTDHYQITSSCYYDTVSIYVPSLYPSFSVSYGDCFNPGSVTVSNYMYYSNITLSLIGGNVTYWSTNGSFPSITVDGQYQMVSIEKVAPGIVAKNDTRTLFVGASGINGNYITFNVEYVTLPLSCGRTGYVNLTPIYNNSKIQVNGTTQTNLAYIPNRQTLFQFSSQCPALISWYSPPTAFNYSYTLQNATVEHFASITLQIYAPVGNIIVNGVPKTGLGPFQLNVQGETPFTTTALNLVNIVYTDNCQVNIYPVVYSVEPTPTPTLVITPQKSDSCNILSGRINVTNASAFSSLVLVRQTLVNGVLNVSPGIYQLIYKVGNTTGTVNVTVPNTDGVILTQSIINPTCSRYLWPSNYNGADTYITFNLTNTTSNTQLPVTNFVQLSGPQTYSTYYPVTKQLIGLLPGDYTGYVQSYFCRWNVNFTVNDYKQPVFTSTAFKTNGSNSGVLVVNNPENRIMSALSGVTQESNNYKQIVNLNNRDYNSTIYVGIVYNEFCSGGINPIVTFAYPVQPTYQVLPSGKCGSVLIQYDQATIDNYNIVFNRNIVINSTTPVELKSAQYQVTYSNLYNFDVMTKQVNIDSDSYLPNNINYTFIPATCYYSNDGRVIINNPDPTVFYSAYDDWNENNVAYNNVTHSFEGLFGGSTLFFIKATKINSQGLVVCDVASVRSVEFDGEVPDYLVPTLQITNSCDGKSNGNVVIGSINSTAIMQGTFIINGTTYTNSSIDLPVGYYQMTIPSMTYGVCTFNQGDNSNTDAMSTAAMGNVGDTPSLQVFNFQIKQASPISIKQLASPKDNCGLVTIQGTGGSGNYTFELYSQNNTMIGSQVSDVNGQVKFSIPSSASSSTFKVIAKDQSSCMTSTINIRGDCSVSSSSTLSISLFFIILSIISLLLI